MKKLSILVSIILLFNVNVIFAEDNASKKVEVTFAVGDSTITIDGVNVEVVTPYVVNGVTLVPVRVITESFGADVSYNSQTAKITVIKENTNSNSIKDYATILKRSTKQYVGDSFNNWTIKHSPQFKLIERSFDGYYNLFASNEGFAYYSITVGNTPKDWSIDERLKYYREEASSHTTIELRKQFW